MSNVIPKTSVKKDDHDEWMATHLNYFKGAKRGLNTVSDPKITHDRLEQLFQTANNRLVQACQRLGAMENKSSETAVHFPKANDMAYAVTRYLPGLNKNTGRKKIL